MEWDLLDSVVGAHGQEIALFRRGSEFSVQVDEAVLMNSDSHHSEDELARLGCVRCTGKPGKRVLVGGLGMGFTLRAALDCLEPDAQVDVAELFPEIVTWNRGPLGVLAGSPLTDPRVRVRLGDVATLLESSVAEYDAILLDVDNGPVAFTAESNDSLYGDDGIERIARALRPGGVLALWAMVDDGSFTARLRDASFHVQKHRVRARVGDGPAHLLWLAWPI